MKAEEMWKVSTGKGIKVAVIDTGVHASTPSLQGQVLPGKHFLPQEGWDTKTDDATGQGTTTAELIAGTGRGGGIRGLAPGAKIIPFKVQLYKPGEQKPFMEDALYRAVKAAVDSDAQIINVSVARDDMVMGKFGEFDAFKYAAEKGKLVFAGTGDNAEQGNKPQYPATDLEVVGVASVDSNSDPAKTSQYGEEGVDLAAPGADTPRWCDAKFQQYCNGGGTVASSAIASASAALIWSKHPDWAANQVLRVMYDTASRNWTTGKRDAHMGHGIIRPRDHLLEGKGNPGTADPGTSAYGVWPTPSAAAPSAPPAKPTKQPKTPALATSSKDTADTGPSPLLVGGIAAAVLLLAAGAFALIRRRRAH